MAALIGAVADNPAVYDALQRAFVTSWPEATVECNAFGLLAVAGKQLDSSSIGILTDRMVAADGERTFRVTAIARSGGQDIPDRLPDGVGNRVQVATTWAELAADATGTIPLYFAESDGGFVFSSHLRPLAQAIGAVIDPVGVSEFMHFGYTVHDRTPFLGIRRVLGGQCVHWERGAGVRIDERSCLWSGFEADFASPTRATAAMGAALDRAMSAVGEVAANVSLMMSAGWDSRTLMAAAASNAILPRLSCYSHGDLQSRELQIAEQLCRDIGVSWHAEPLDASNYDVEQLDTAVRRTENVVFPHWHRAGRLLAPQGGVVMAGVFGEMVGGRYWSAHAKSGAAKAATLFPMLLGAKGPPMLSDAESLRQATALFSLTGYRHSWTTNLADVQEESDTQREMNADITRALTRYQQRGATGLDQLAEAYQGEHIGSRYCNVQLLSVRGYTEVAFPLANTSLLEIATRTPLNVRIQNSVSRLLVRAREPRLLRRPMGATLAPASAPIVVQEASRVARKLYQMGNWSAHFVSGGRIPVPRLAWANYEFLRTGNVLRQTVESLQSTLWNTRALFDWVERVERGQFHEQMLDPAEMLGKMVTLDYLTR